MDENENLPAEMPPAPVEPRPEELFFDELFALDRALRANGLSIRELVSDLARHHGVSV